MAESFDWPGASGRTYKYAIHDLDWVPAPNQDGNYIFARSTGTTLTGITWHAIYVGQGDLRDRRQAALDEGCVQRKGATHRHCHLNAREEERLAEEEDVLEGNPEAYVPDGCNERRGG